MNLVKRFKQNTAGRDLIVGDVHGHFSKLQAALDAIGFDPACDRLFSVGDLVDRGPESDDVLAWLAKPWFHPVRGNHDEMAIDYAAGALDRGSYMVNGGAWNIGNTPELRNEIRHAMLDLPIAIELQTSAGLVGVVHADVPVLSWSMLIELLEGQHANDWEVRHLISMAMWNRQRVTMGDRSKVQGVHAVVVGHNVVDSHLVLGNVHHIDTGGWLGREFTILNADTLTAEIQRAKEAA